MTRILVVDDKAKARQLLAEAAHVSGADVVTAGSAKEASQEIAHQTFDVVVTDLHMETPVAGLEVLKAAKEKDGDTQVIVVTAYGTPRISMEIMDMGAFDYLEKNAPGTDVLGVVRSKVNLALDYRAKSRTEAMFGPPRQDCSWPKVFVLMAFTAKLKRIYDDHIKKAVLQVKLDVGRADDFCSSEEIMKDVWSAIHAAHLVIADCTGRNPNVFYEIGIAHTLGKETILISQSLKDVPFDLRRLRVIVYEYTPPGMEAFEKALISTITKSGKVSSPQAPSDSTGAP